MITTDVFVTQVLAFTHRLCDWVIDACCPDVVTAIIQFAVFYFKRSGLDYWINVYGGWVSGSSVAG